MSTGMTCIAVGCVVMAQLLSATPIQAQSAEAIRNEADKAPNRVDITDAILTRTAPDCAIYSVIYTSEVTDLQRRRAFDGAVIVTVDENSCTIQSNGIPNHDFGGGSERPFAAPVAEIGAAFTIPRKPQRAGTPSRLTHRRFDAILLNGVVVDILSAGCYDPDGRRPDRNGNVLAGCPDTARWLIDPMSSQSPFAEDDHNAHAQPDGRYHYHGNPMALFNDKPGPDGSPLIGFAADGFPIYGSYFRDASGTVRKAKSGYTLRTGTRPSGSGNPGGTYNGLYRADYEFTGNGDLDACNGMTVNGTYAYYVTDEFPWMIACFTGTPDPSFNKRRR